MAIEGYIANMPSLFYHFSKKSIDIATIVCGLLSIIELIIGQLFIGICWRYLNVNNYKHLKNVLFHIIKNLSDVCSIFCVNPDADFTRNRKLDFETIMKIILCMGSSSIKDELLKFNDFSIDTPSASAFVQARSKIKPEAFKALFDGFNNKTFKKKLYHGYRLLAIDGSELPIDNTIFDDETTELRHGTLAKAYSAFHLNASYDLLERTYDDIIIQGEAKKDENDAFCQLVDRYDGHKAIFIADRGYESYNGFEHVVRSGNKYLIRVKDIGSQTSITRSLGPFPEGEFDIDVFRMLTLKQTKTTKACPEIYKIVTKSTRFDFMSKDDPWYEFNCRVVRFKITEDTYETVITNLSREEFSMEEIREIYNMRWGEETSFRELKYAIGLNALHAKKRKLIQQEIYACMTMYNFCQRIVQEIKIPKKDKIKYTYQVNFTRSVHIIREFLRKKGGKNPPVEHLIAKEILPIRPGRKYKRHVKPKTVVFFNYRYN